MGGRAFTDRELAEVAKMVRQGRTGAYIAEKLGRSQSGVCRLLSSGRIANLTKNEVDTDYPLTVTVSLYEREVRSFKLSLQDSVPLLELLESLRAKGSK